MPRVHVLAVAVAMFAACGRGPAVTPAPPHVAPLPPLGEPAPIDPSVRGAAYLAAIAAPLQRGWRGFLEDCRTRLPASDPLNVMTREATVELAIGSDGRVGAISLSHSGADSFDRAIRGVLADASPLPTPPVELRSDDDRLHVRWLFARDRRQAGPATAAIEQVDLPLADAVDAWIKRGDLTLAARRLARAPSTDDRRRTAIIWLAAAIYREALGSADRETRRAAVVAIGRTWTDSFGDLLGALLDPTEDADVRMVAVPIAASHVVQGAAKRIHDALIDDLRSEPALVPVEVDALIRLGKTDAATSVLWHVLDAEPGNLAAIAATAALPYDAARAPQLERWLTSRDARVRAAACTALASHPAASALVRGMRDPVAGVRTACAQTAASAAGQPAVAAALTALLRDRDDAVRATAVLVLAPAAAASDSAAPVRAALATTLVASLPKSEPLLRALAADRDDTVRAAAYASLAARGRIPADLVAAVVADPSPRVRLAATRGLDDDAALARLVDDADPMVASEALVRQTARAGAAASFGPTLDRIIAAPPASAERVRAALAWLLAQ